jgi:hypothetical protein
VGHHLHAFLGRPDLLARLAPHIRDLRLIALPQGLALAPIVPEQYPLGDDEPAGPGDLIYCPGSIADAAALVSRHGLVGWMESDYHAGIGESRAALWRDGAFVPMPEVNPLLRELGVACTAGLDEWDTVGLGGLRASESAYEKATPVKE